MKKNSLLITFGIISVILVTIFLWIVIPQYNVFIWEEAWNKDPSIQVRNLILSCVAIGSFPFLILGHVLRRSDLESKRQDTLLKTETIIFNEGIKEIQEAKIEFEKISKYQLEELFNHEPDSHGGVHVDIHSPSLIFQEHKTIRSKGEGDYYLSTSDLVDNLKKSKSHVINAFYTVSKRIETIFKLSEQFENSNLRTLIISKFNSSFSLEEINFLMILNSIKSMNYSPPKIGINAKYEANSTIYKGISQLSKEKLIVTSDFAELVMNYNSIKGAIEKKYNKKGTA